jgi:hypothetical protein
MLWPAAMILRKHDGCAFVLWADYYDALLTALFAANLRRAGWHTRLIGLNGDTHSGCNGIKIVADISLSQAVGDLLPYAAPIPWTSDHPTDRRPIPRGHLLLFVSPRTVLRKHCRRMAVQHCCLTAAPAGGPPPRSALPTSMPSQRSCSTAHSPACRCPRFPTA